jgi:hypothetical protein
VPIEKLSGDLRIVDTRNADIAGLSARVPKRRG